MRAQRNKLLSAFENLQGSGGPSHMLETKLRCAKHDSVGNDIALLFASVVCLMQCAIQNHALDAEIHLHAELWQD